MDVQIDYVREILRDAKSVAVLTGAGVSAESGIATFRDPDGLWAKFSPRELASMDGFLANPERVREWYAYRKAIARSVEPNAGHYALAALEQRARGTFTLITQNVDRLHQRAGSVNVLEVHGNLIENRCNDCDHIRTDDLLTCPICQGAMRPNVVWFGEELPQDVFAAAEQAAMTCDVMIVAGTSAEVYPAAGLPYTAKRYGGVLVEVNPNRTELTAEAHHVLTGTSAHILPLLVGDAS
ncbi:MAG: SIR2 family NAD-dependent protein deacylase [Bacteroidota bacterium]